MLQAAQEVLTNISCAEFYVNINVVWNWRQYKDYNILRSDCLRMQHPALIFASLKLSC